MGPAAVAVSRKHCVLIPTAADTFSVESRCTNVTGVRSAPGANWIWLRRGERVDGVGAGWQLAFDRALSAATLFTFQASNASPPKQLSVGSAAWSWQLKSGWSPYSAELTSRLEGAWAAGAASLALDAERRAVFGTMRQVSGCGTRALLTTCPHHTAEAHHFG